MRALDKDSDGFISSEEVEARLHVGWLAKQLDLHGLICDAPSSYKLGMLGKYRPEARQALRMHGCMYARKIMRACACSDACMHTHMPMHVCALACRLPV